jgi:hypothetical protein
MESCVKGIRRDIARNGGEVESVTAVSDAEGPELPDWITETPDDNTYNLEMWDENETIQSIDLTRVEYLTLKRHLAEMRGFVMPEVVHA